MIVYDCLKWNDSAILLVTGRHGHSMVIPSPRAQRGARVLAMIIQGMIEALIRMERKVLTIFGIFGTVEISNTRPGDVKIAIENGHL